MAVLGVLLLGLVACGDVLVRAGLGSDEGSWVSRSSALPAPTEDAVTLTAFDLDLAAEAAGVDQGDVMGIALASIEGPVAPLFPTVLDQQTMALEGFEETTGFAREDVRWAAEVDQTPSVASVLGMDVDIEALEAVNGPVEDGVIRSDDPFAVDMEARGPGRMLGRQPRHDLFDDQMMLSRWMEDPTEGPRLDDHPGFRSVLEAFDDLEVYAGQAMYRRVVGGDGEGLSTPSTERTDAAVPEPYEVTAIGFPMPEGEQVRAAAFLVHDDPSRAATNAEALDEILREGRLLRSARPWAELVTDVEVTQEDTLVTARFVLVEDVPPMAIVRAFYEDGFVPHLR